MKTRLSTVTKEKEEQPQKPQMATSEINEFDSSKFRIALGGRLCIPYETTFIGELKSYCFKKIKTVKIPSTVRELGDCTFRICSMLSKVICKEGMLKLGVAAFMNCMKLKKIVLPKSLEEIGDVCFYHCSSIKKLTIPASVRYIDEYAFCGMNKKAKIIIEGSTKWWHAKWAEDCPSKIIYKQPQE